MGSSPTSRSSVSSHATRSYGDLILRSKWKFVFTSNVSDYHLTGGQSGQIAFFYAWSVWDACTIHTCTREVGAPLGFENSSVQFLRSSRAHQDITLFLIEHHPGQVFVASYFSQPVADDYGQGVGTRASHVDRIRTAMCVS